MNAISITCYTHSFNLLFFNNTSTRAISHFLYTTASIKVSHVTIFSCHINLPNTKHIPVAPMSSDTNNNLIESFNKTYKACYKAKKGFNSFEKANNLIYLFIFHYNFIRPHGSLNSHTPAEVAGFASNSKSKKIMVCCRLN